MKTDMAAMRQDEFEKYVFKHKIVEELYAMEIVLTAMRDNTEYYCGIGLRGDLSGAINNLWVARRRIEEIMLKLAIDRKNQNSDSAKRRKRRTNELIQEEAKDTEKAMIEGQKHGKIIHEKVKASAEVIA